jgi:protein SFI1
VSCSLSSLFVSFPESALLTNAFVLDIKLLAEIVTAAEEIYPTLAERDRLPTNALFLAAEQVLPVHGYDPDHAPSNISRLIFKIGGLRSEGSLMDKFRSVLESMGIEIEFVQPLEQQQQPQHRDRSSSIRSAGSLRSSIAGNPGDQTGTFPITPHYEGRRRRNSDSAAPAAPTDDLRDVPTIFNRARSVSVGSQQSEGLRNVRGTQGPRRPGFQGTGAKEAEAIQSEDDDLDEWNPHDLPIRTRPLPAHEDEEDDDFPYERHDVEGYPASDTGEVEEFGHGNHYQNPHGYPYDLPRARDDSDNYADADDATAETSNDLLSDPVLTEDARTILERKVRAFQNRRTTPTRIWTLAAWEKSAKETGKKRTQQEARAAFIAQHCILYQAFDDWSRTTWESKRLRRAAKAYDIHVMFKSFTHWEECAREELERTAIARRHMLRIRYFTLWRSLQADSKKKVHLFRADTLLRTWTRAYMHHEVQQSVAAKQHHDNLAKSALNTWLDKYRGRFADRVRILRLKESCVRIWHAKTRQAIDMYEGIIVHEREQLLEDSLSAWQAVTEDMHIAANERLGQKITHDLQNIFDTWRTKAQLNKNLRAAIERRELKLKVLAIDCWVSKTAEAAEKAQLATRLASQDVIAHWRNEAKLKLFRTACLAQLKLYAFSHWRLEQQLASFDRLSETRTKEAVLARLRTAAAQAQTRAVQGYRFADNHADRTIKASIIRAWQTKATAAVEERDTAVAMYFHNTASSCVGLWAVRADEVSTRRVEYEAFADRGAYYCMATNTLTRWVEVADRTRRERLTRTYHAFRRKHKASLAAKCLSRWHSAARNVLAFASEADMVCATRAEDKLVECVQHWREQARTMQAINQVAKEAELEVWWGKWTTRATELRETEMDAAAYCNEQMLSRCWNNWEFAALQNRGRQNTVAAFKEKIDKSLCRQVLDIWLQKVAAPEGLLIDLRSSVASRRSVRYSNVRPGSVRPAALSTSQHLQPPAFDSSVNQQPDLHLSRSEETTLATSPRRQQFGRQSEPPRKPSNDRPQGLSYSVPPRPRGYPKQEPPQYSSSGIYPTSTLQQTPHITPRPSGAPFPDFDEDDISFSPSEAGDPDHPTTFMSTPTRWTGSARATARNIRPLHATTTPSALLDTPHERALRREYTASGGGGGAGTRSVAAGTRFTPRVTFADIREESGEDSRIFESRR